ncbi:MAG: class I SAM-dependent methyltransferase [Steroidobacteraceae bacterium]
MTSPERAVFISRDHCLGCHSTSLDVVASGRFDQGRVGEFLAADPWGEDPLPFLTGATWTLVRCRSCSLKFHREILSPEWGERRFSKWMTSDAIKAFEAGERNVNSFDRAASFAEHVVRIENLLRVSRPGKQRRKVLDFGCGDGEFIGLCAAFGFEAYGVDRSTARRENAGVKVYANLESASKHAPFDAITLFEVVEHLDDPGAILKTLHGLLDANGLLVLEAPNCKGVNNIETLADFRAIHPLEHINAFEPATLQAFAERIGFRREERRPVWVTGRPLVALRRLVRSWLSPVVKADTRLYFRKA